MDITNEEVAKKIKNGEIKSKKNEVKQQQPDNQWYAKNYKNILLWYYVK